VCIVGFNNHGLLKDIRYSHSDNMWKRPLGAYLRMRNKYYIILFGNTHMSLFIYLLWMDIKFLRRYLKTLVKEI